MDAPDDSQTATRIERDAMGEVAVPASARWGAQTQRAIDNFDVSGRPLDLRVVHALAAIKAEAALVNSGLSEVGGVDAAMGAAIAEAAAAVAEGRFDDQFRIDVYQTGSGTSTNMNVNEVLASLASEQLGRDVHPNDHVNASQSSNDTMPSAARLAALVAVDRQLGPATDRLVGSLRRRSDDLADVVKAGRTHLMDATPVTLGQELAGWAAQIEDARARHDDAVRRVSRLPLGGTATGTGLNAPPAFAPRVIAGLRARLGIELTEAPDRFATQGAHDDLAELSAAVRSLALALVKIADDLRLLASGPRTGLAELRLPELQPGSSIMPGKVNPVIPESVTQVGARIIGLDATIAFAASQGTLELNTYLPVMAHSLLEAISLAAAACELLARSCIDGMVADEERCREHAERTAALATALNPVIGYDRASEAVKEAVATGRTVREVVQERGWVSAAVLDEALDLHAMADGGMRSGRR